MDFKKYKVSFIIAISIIVITFIAFGIFALYVSDFYHADKESIEAFTSDMSVEKTELYEGATSYKTGDSEIGFIFYPGGKVEYEAYEPLMYQLAYHGITCILIEMPLNLAIFNANAADKVLKLFPEVQSWYIGGHSLGGSIAASYLDKSADKFEGLVLLAAYSTANLSNKDLDVLSIYGSEDKVMNKTNYVKYKSNLPIDTSYIEIPGGCHAYFGMYGNQKGDGNPTITAEEQICLTAEYIDAFIRFLN